MCIVFADRFGQIIFLCWILNFMRYGDRGIYRIRSPWEILQLYLQESDYCSVPAGSQHPLFIFVCPLSAASIAVTDSGGFKWTKFFFSGKRMQMKHWFVVPSPYDHYTFWVKLKLLFGALSLFKHCKISLPFVIEKDELSVLFLNYTGFSSKHRRVRVLWWYIKNFIRRYLKIVYIHKLNFSFFFIKAGVVKDTLLILYPTYIYALKILTFQNRHCHPNFT